MDKGTLYIISTPIGNLEDMTLRGIRLMKEADIIAAEDTRRTRVLMQAHGISGDLTSFHAHNIKRKTPGIIKALKEGKTVALVSDSGTPGISDPGSTLIAECVKEDIPLTACPGPAAFITALVLSGKPTHKFVFEGFLSNKSARRKKQLEVLRDEERTVVVYESPHRIIRFLEDYRDVFGDREIVVARELTKKFEEMMRGTASELLERFQKDRPRGEMVVVF